MAVPLSTRTKELLAKLFVEPRLSEIRETLVEFVGADLPFCSEGTPDSLERIRFAVAKLVREGTPLEDAIDLAETDWRDLLMAAGFGDLGADAEWHKETMRPD